MAPTSTPESMHVGSSSIAWLVHSFPRTLALNTHCEPHNWYICQVLISFHYLSVSPSKAPNAIPRFLVIPNFLLGRILTRDSKRLFADTQSPRNASRLHSTVHDEQCSLIGVLQAVLVEVCPKALQGQDNGTPGKSKLGIHCERGDHHDQCVHEREISRQ